MNHLELSLRASMLSTVVLCTNATALAAHEGWGIVVDRFDRVYFADIPANVVWRISPDGRIEAVLRDVHSHALALGFDGSVHGTDVDLSGSRDVWRLDMSGRRSNLIFPESESILDLQPFLIGNDGAVYSVTRYQPELPVERRSLYLLRRDRSGKVDTLAGGNVGYADGRGRAARFTSIDGMAWLPDGRIAFVDGARVRAISRDANVGSLSGELTRPQWDQDLMGLSVTADGAILVGDFAGRRVIKLHDGKATTIFSSGLLWSPTGATETKKGVYVLEHLRAPLGILGDLKIGPYLQVRFIGTDGRSRVISRRWGANSTAVFSVIAVIALLLVLVVGRSRARSRRQT